MRGGCHGDVDVRENEKRGKQGGVVLVLVLVLVLMLMLMLMLTLMLMLMLTLMLVLVSVLMLVLVSVLVPASIVWLWLDSASFHPVSLQRPAALWSTWVCVCLHMCAHFLSIIFLWGGGKDKAMKHRPSLPLLPLTFFCLLLSLVFLNLALGLLVSLFRNCVGEPYCLLKSNQIGQMRLFVFCRKDCQVKRERRRRRKRLHCKTKHCKAKQRL